MQIQKSSPIEKLMNGFIRRNLIFITMDGGKEDVIYDHFMNEYDFSSYAGIADTEVTEYSKLYFGLKMAW